MHFLYIIGGGGGGVTRFVWMLPLLGERDD